MRPSYVGREHTDTEDSGHSVREGIMLELTSSENPAGDRGRNALSAVVVVLCYLIVFAGILYSLAGA